VGRCDRVRHDGKKDAQMGQDETRRHSLVLTGEA
jgi:hypothetical protein